LSSRTHNALDAPVSSEQIRSSKRLKRSALIVWSQIKSGRELQTVGPAIDKKIPDGVLIVIIIIKAFTASHLETRYIITYNVRRSKLCNWKSVKTCKHMQIYAQSSRSKLVVSILPKII